VGDEESLQTQVNYFYSTTDCLAKVILSEWNKKDLKTFDTQREIENKFNQFKNQWNNILKELNEEFGLPTLK
jgi:hypothetical protein